jgi:hypothetical protein
VKLIPVQYGPLNQILNPQLRSLQVLQLDDIHLGDRVLVVHRGQPGVVRFKGLTQFGKGEWVGIELGVPEGKHNGTWLGVSYFECPENHGIFVRVTNLELRDEEVGADVIASGGGPDSAAERPQADVSPVTLEGRPGGSADVMTTIVQEEGGVREGEGSASAPGAAPFSPWRSSGTRPFLQEKSSTAQL